MSTSGTVGTTVINTSLVLEHAFRRCKVKPALQTPENVALARENLYLLLLSLSNRGLNLWCVDTEYVGINAAQAVYNMPTGTIDLLNLIYSKPTLVTGTNATTAKSYATTFSAATLVKRIGFKLSAVTAADTLTLDHSPDGATWTTISTVTKTDWATGEWYWFNLDPTITDFTFRASFGSAATFSTFYLATSIYDLPLTQWNRDTWSTINNKSQPGRPSTCYYYEKLLTPRVTLWPVPNNDYDHLTVFIHRQVQDVGTLMQQLEVPQRWVDGIIWQLAGVLCFELDIVDPSLIPIITQKAADALQLSEQDETDGAPIYMQPNIRGYSR